MKTTLMLKVEEEYKKPIKNIIENMYLTKQMSPREIDKELKIGSGTSREWIIKFDIPKRNLSEGLKNRKRSIYLGKHLNKESKKKISEGVRRCFLTKEEMEWFYIHDKLPIIKIAKRTNLGETTISRWMRKYNIPIRNSSERTKGHTSSLKGKFKLFPLTKEETEDLFINKEMTKKEIGEKFNVSMWQIDNWFRRYGIFQTEDLHIKKARKHQFKALLNRPNNIEQKMIDIIHKCNLSYKYVGNGDFILKGRNPDFINTNGKKEVVEIFGNYWHSPLYGRKIPFSRSYEGTIKHYKKYGFKCIIFWEDEVNEEMVKERLGVII